MYGVTVRNYAQVTVNFQRTETFNNMHDSHLHYSDYKSCKPVFVFSPPTLHLNILCSTKRFVECEGERKEVEMNTASLEHVS
jgi:hypothetical protein